MKVLLLLLACLVLCSFIPSVCSLDVSVSVHLDSNVNSQGNHKSDETTASLPNTHSIGAIADESANEIDEAEFVAPADFPDLSDFSRQLASFLKTFNKKWPTTQFVKRSKILKSN